MVGGARAVLAGIRTIADMVAAFEDEDRCRRLHVSQPTAWRMGHALRLLVTSERQLGGTVEIDEFYLGGGPRDGADRPRLGRGRNGHPRTTKTPVLAVVQRPTHLDAGAPAGTAGARVVRDLSVDEAGRVLGDTVDPSARLISDAWSSFLAIGHNFASHDTVRHSELEYARGPVHANSVESFNDRVRRTVAGVFHHISRQHADLYFNEVGFRWSQRVVAGHVVRGTRGGRQVTKRMLGANSRISARVGRARRSTGNRIRLAATATSSVMATLSVT